MAVITQTIQPGEQRNEVTEIQKALIILNATIDPGEIFTPDDRRNLWINHSSGDHRLTSALRLCAT